MSRARSHPAGRPRPVSRDIDRALAAAIEWQKAGDLNRASMAYRRILEQWPDQPDALHLLGVVALQTDHVEKAIDLIARAIKVNGSTPLFHNNLGNALRKQGHPDKAIASYQSALAIDPEYTQALSNLASTLHEAGRLGEAIGVYRRAIEIDPRSAGALCNLGAALQEQGQPDKAIVYLRRALTLEPNFAGALFNLGNALTTLGRIDEAASCYRRALALEPGNAVAHNNLGVALRQAGEIDKAIDCFRRAADCDRDYAVPLNELAYTLQALGRFDEARKAYRQAIAMRPGYAMPYANLAYITKSEPGDPIAERMGELLREEGLSTEHRWAVHFALGKCFDDQARYDDAFDHYRAANELRGGAAAFDPAAWEDEVRQIMSTFSPRFLAERAGLGSDSDRPLFVLGMPRSGTSLVEQILAGHPEIAGAGELNDLYFMVGKLPAILGTDTPYPSCAELINGDSAASLARGYLDHLQVLAPTAKRVVDKMPHNFLRLGLIALLFPRARVIHCRRDPIDVCLSCYFQSFKEVHSFSYDLGNLGLYYQLYERLMAHWRTALTLPTLEVSYEALTADPEGVAREMIEFCDLSWDDRCLSYHERDHPILTVSVWQARQPVYRTSVQRWKRYEKHLGPLLKALEGAPPGPQVP